MVFLSFCQHVTLNILILGKKGILKSSESLQNHWTRVGTELLSSDLDSTFSRHALVEVCQCKAPWKMNKKVLVRTGKERRCGNRGANTNKLKPHRHTHFINFAVLPKSGQGITQCFCLCHVNSRLWSR